jgi:hypothetical protein
MYMGFRNMYIAGLAVLAAAGCAHIKEAAGKECSCDALYNSFPPETREYLRDGEYDIRGRTYIKKGHKCFEVNKPDTRDSDSLAGRLESQK